MRLVGSDKNQKEIEIDGKVIAQQKDGTFHTDDLTAKRLLTSGDFGVVGITFRNAQGYICSACSFNNVFRDKCGRCGCTDLTPEE